MLQAVLLTVLIWSNHYNVWEILSLSFMLGLINAFDVPARQSLVNEMIDDKKYLSNALALNSSMVNLSRLIGPGIAGLILEKYGDTACFGINAISFIAVIGSLLMMKLPKPETKPHNKNVLQDLKDGLKYIQQTPSLKFIILMLGAMSLFVLPFSTLIPVYAKDIFKGTASTFGIIDSMIGVWCLSWSYLFSIIKTRQ